LARGRPIGAAFPDLAFTVEQATTEPFGAVFRV